MRELPHPVGLGVTNALAAPSPLASMSCISAMFELILFIATVLPTFPAFCSVVIWVTVFPDEGVTGILVMISSVMDRRCSNAATDLALSDVAISLLAGLTFVLRNSSPTIAVLAGTMIGNTSSKIPVFTFMV